MSCPSGTEPSSPINLPPFIVAWIDFNWSWKPRTSDEENYTPYLLASIQSTNSVRVLTFDRVFAADKDLRMDTRVSWVGASSGDRNDRICWSSAKRISHFSIRFSRRVSKWGEYAFFPRSSVSLVFLRVCAIDSRSLALKKAASLR